MKINNEILKFLRGESFSNSLIVEISKTKYEINTREKIILEIVKNQDVIHMGCSDHIQIIQEKIKSGTWLHKLITDNSKSCLGIDIDKESVNYIKQELGFSNVVYGNIMTDDLSEITGKKWDYVVFGEIIEHLDNPVTFLKVFRDKYSSHVKKFVVTVPTIYNRRNARSIFKYREIINSDHRFWFTPYTICKLLLSAGYNPDCITYSNLTALGTWELIIRKIKYFFGMPVKYPYYFFNTLIVTGSLI